jgi:hypothetical protein
MLLIAGCSPMAVSPTATAPITPTTKPIESPLPTPSATITRRPAPTEPTSTPDYLIEGTAIAQTVVAIVRPRIYASYPSPDRKWQVDILIHDCTQIQADGDPNAYEQMNLIQVNGGSETVVDSQLQNCGGVGAYGLGGLYWSPNSRYFYYTDARESFPDGAGGYWARPIKRVDVLTQEVLDVGGGHLSPDKKKLAFWEENEIVLWSLDEDEIGRLPAIIPGAFHGQIAWSQDGNSLAYLQTELDCYPYGKSYVRRVHLRPLIQSLLFESESPSFGFLAWDAPYRISLVDEQGDKWSYNLASKDLRPVP